MWFKNMVIYRLHAQPQLDAGTLEEALTEHAARSLAGQDPKRMGWTSPGGRRSQQLCHELQGHRLLTALRQERLLPAGVVKEEVEERALEIEEREGRKLRRQERVVIKEQVYEEFLPRAFVRSQRIDLWWDTRRQLIAINASSRKRAEEVLDLLRETLGSLKVTPLATQDLPIRAMTRWLSEPNTRPAWLALGDSAQVASKGDDAKFTARQADLDGDEIRAILESGRMATKVAIGIEGKMSFVLQDDLSIKQVRFADALIDEASSADDGDDAIIRLETDFVLMAGALAECVELMLEALGGEAQVAAEPQEEAGAQEAGQGSAAAGNEPNESELPEDDQPSPPWSAGEGSATEPLVDALEPAANS